jgi:hypothetical protein
MCHVKEFSVIQTKNHVKYMRTEMPKQQYDSTPNVWSLTQAEL